MHRSIYALLALLLPAVAMSEVKQGAPDGALIEHRFRIAAPPTAAWQALLHPERWWPADHTWSGEPGKLSLEPDAGGCFREGRGGASAERARVVMVKPGELLRLRGSLGPLQEMAVTGVLTVNLAAKDGGTEAGGSYRAGGPPC